jgi:hypothetical protein
VTVDGPADAADRPVVEQWWSEFIASGRLPAELELVQGRLVRAVCRGDLPSGPVFVKAMTFPRAKDRLRYLLRELPAAHEARLLRATASAGIVCPEVVAVRTARRSGLPFRSLLVLRALPVAPVQRDPSTRLGEEAALAMRLLTAAIVHPDLHSGNFVDLANGELAVIDLQSARRGSRKPAIGDRVRAAARLLQDREAGAPAEALVAAGLLRDDDEVRRAVVLAARRRARFLRSRVLRCLGESTEFTRHGDGRGVEHRVRAPLPPGAWRSGDTEARAVWIGQRARQVLEGGELLFPAYRRKWWWLGGGGALYVPLECSEELIQSRQRASLQACSAMFGQAGSGWARFGWGGGQARRND